MRRLVTGGLAVAALIAGCCLVPGSAAAAPGARGPHIANACFALRSAATGRYVGVSGQGYRADQRAEGTAAAFFWKPSSLRSYLPMDQGGSLLGLNADGSVGRQATPGPASDWTALPSGRRSVRLRALTQRRWLTASASGDLIASSRDGRPTIFRLVRNRGCTPFPEADVGATGRSFRGSNHKGDVFGFADMHVHITANLRAGGAVLSGEPYDPYGISEALGHDADVHGADGSLDITGNLLRTGLPFGTHDTHGWPSFAGWPVHDTITHQQTYYVWLKRAWLAGERLVVAQTVEDQSICEIETVKTHSCDETTAVRQQVQELRGLQNYIDAQAGGKGRGWFRLVYNPRQARDVIERGKLAVLIGIESSNLFGCSEQMDVPQCGRHDIDRGIRNARRLGVRTVFPHALDGQRLRWSGDRGRRQGHVHQRAGAVPDRPLLPHGPLSGAGPGRDDGQPERLRAQLPVQLLPCREAARPGGISDLPGGDSVQRQGPDPSRRLPDQAADGQPYADRDGPHERVGPRERPADGEAPPVSPGLQPHRDRRLLDPGPAQAALRTRRHGRRQSRRGARARGENR